MGFKIFETEDIVLSNESVSTSIWSSNITGVLNTFPTSSNQVDTEGKFYISVYNNTDFDEVQFDVAYCDIMGSGSADYNENVPGYSPSRSNYAKYNALVLGNSSTGFRLIGTSLASDYFYVISFERARYKEKLLAGSLEIELGNKTLTDDSSINSPSILPYVGRKYNLVEGEIGNVLEDATIYGWVLPDMGLILLDGVRVDSITGPSTIRTSNTESYNPSQIISNLAAFQVQSEESLSSDFIFVRAKNNEFNYSNNPTFMDSSGEVINSSFVQHPKTFITTVGLYNDLGSLVAVAKLSRPLMKDFTKELLIRIKLDF